MADLRDLGLSEYEASVYRSLLEIGPATAKELSAASDVPMGRIYDVLGSVESQHLVRSQDASRPKKYVAVDPETALDRLLSDRKRELEERATQYEQVVEELSQDLREPATPDDGFWTAALGPAESVDLLVERLDAATESVVLIGDTPSSSFDLADLGGRIVDHLEGALDRGAEVSALLSEDLVASLPQGVNDRSASALSDDPGYRVRVGEGVDGNVVILDGVEVCLEVSNPVKPDESFALIALTDPSFARDVREEFEESWSAAVPLERFDDG